MTCPKCGSQNNYVTGVSGDTAGRVIHHLSCSRCSHSWTTASHPARAPELPDELVINGITYRRVEE